MSANDVVPSCSADATAPALPVVSASLQKASPRNAKVCTRWSLWPAGRFLAAPGVAILGFLLVAWRRGHRSHAPTVEIRLLQEEETREARLERCRPARKPQTWGRVFSLPSETLKFCGEIPTSDLLAANMEVAGISYLALTQTAEILVMAQKNGPLYQLNVMSDGDTPRWDVIRPPYRSFKQNNCLDFEQFCEVASVTPVLGGLIVVDRHRIQAFNFSWGEADAEELVLSTLGKMNMAAPALGVSELFYPNQVAVYQPYNATHFSEDMQITPLHFHSGERFFFVTDTGKHRVILINATRSHQMEYISQFGVSGEARNDHTGFNHPLGIAVMTPAFESIFDSTFANVFVADKFNHRLVKLNLGYTQDPLLVPPDKPSLLWSGEYHEDVTGAMYSQSLMDPCGVSVFRNYILVAEAAGNAITVLTVDYIEHDKLIFVTQLTAATEYQLSGSLAASPHGYVWFTYVHLPATHSVGSLFLPEALRESAKAEWIEDFRAECTNQTIYNTFLMSNSTMYREHVQYVLNAARINWRFPNMPNFIHYNSFNLSDIGLFDLLAWNDTVLNGEMFFCQPPPPPTTPPMLSATEDGWNSPGAAGSAATANSRRCSAGAAVWATVSFALLLGQTRGTVQCGWVEWLA